MLMILICFFFHLVLTSESLADTAAASEMFQLHDLDAALTASAAAVVTSDVPSDSP